MYQHFVLDIVCVKNIIIIGKFKLLFPALLSPASYKNQYQVYADWSLCSFKLDSNTTNVL